MVAPLQKRSPAVTTSRTQVGDVSQIVITQLGQLQVSHSSSQNRDVSFPSDLQVLDPKDDHENLLESVLSPINRPVISPPASAVYSGEVYDLRDIRWQVRLRNWCRIVQYVNLM